MSQHQDGKTVSQSSSAMTLKQRLARLSPEKLAALQKRLQQQDRSGYEPMRALPDEAVYPLSLNQRRLWFIEQFQPGTPLYNVTRALRLRGALDREALRLALQGLVDRHETLRTTFEMHDGGPVQRINVPTELPLPLIDLRTAAEDRDSVETLLQERLTAEGRRTFDLSADLMLRTVLYQLANDEYVLQITIHHLACDGWSLRLLFNHLAEMYGQFCSGRTDPLKPAGIRYVDFARCQQEPKQQARFDERVQWWNRRLAGAPQVLELTPDRPRPKMESGSGAFQPFDLPFDLQNQLETLSREEGATPFVTMLTGFFILLHRYTGMKEFLVGTAIAGRHRPETHDLVGFFVDTVILRADLSGEPTARQLLRRVRQTVIDAVAYGDVPFERIVESIAPPKDLSRHPLFQVLFNAPPQFSLELSGLDVSPVHVDLQISRFDLEMTCSGGHNRLAGITWNTDLFDADTIQRMLGHYGVLLKAIAEDPDRPVHQLPLLREQERHQLLVEWNDTAVEYPHDKCVHELFEEQAEHSPDAVAVVFADQQLTYRELNERANQLAHYLIGEGVQPNTLVGICVERSLEMVVGLLGILKAGGAYVPLDPDYPQERLRFMLEDADVRLLLTQEAVDEDLPNHTSQRLHLTRDGRSWESCPESNPQVNSRPEDLAYVIYTSGSTGQPKGVQIEQRAVVNFLESMAQEPGIRPEDVLLAVTTLSFDIAVLELFLPLLKGAKIVLAGRECAADGNALQMAIDQNGVTAMQATPASWKLMIEAGWDGTKNLRILCGGEAMPLSLASQLVRRCFEVWNMYGPTETTIWSTCCQIENPADIHIGKPLANTQVYILDNRQQLVPIGVPGELCIAGDGLARGYLNRAELTAETFVANPFRDDPDSRLYRTGDLCRWRADGNLEFLRRLDHQVKLRGFRIELGEIEVVLNAHPKVAQSVVTLREDRPGDKRLVAYCVPRAADAEPPFSELRSHLRERLPDYMVPAAFIVLDGLPLTPSGKINRRGLPAPDDSRPDLDAGYVAPRTPVEEQLAAIWQELLGIERVGVHDNFFALGGHSLLAMRMNARIASTCEVDLPLRRLFEAPTIAELTGEIEALRCGAARTRSAALKPMDRERIDRLPLSFAQQRLWFLEQLEGELTAYNMPMAWRLGGTLDVEALRRALETIVRRHETLRTTFTMSGEEPVQVIGPIDRFELPVKDLGALEPEQREAEIARRGRLEAEQPFDLTSDLMLRASLLRVSDDEHVLLLTLHHIASDGWSMGVLRRELGELYAAHCRGVDPKLPGLPVQYADYALWQRKELDGQRLDELLHYWRGQLDGVSALEMPTDRPRPPLPTYRGARHTFELPGELVDRLKSLDRAEGVTLHMILLAAFQTLLSRYSGQDDIAVGTPIAGRNHSDLEEQIGFFVNTLVLRTDLAGAPTFRELLNRVRQVSLAAYDHQDLPFEKLVEELQPERQRNRSPLFQVMFQLLNFAERELSVGDLDVSRMPSGSERVRFDLEMHLWQHPDRLSGVAIYSTDLFDGETIERMVGHFVTLLEGIVADPDRRVGVLPLLREPERHQLLVQWNDTAIDYPQRCVHQLFEEQVERTPDAVAVVFEDQQLTYRQLNKRANQLAHYLIEQGVRGDTLVGICIERSLEMIVGLLGILKAGGAYVPLDPDYPQERLRFMLEDAGVEWLITQETLDARLPNPTGERVYLNPNGRPFDSYPVRNPQVSSRPGHLCYVIYTSGSTGRPKGVMVEHAGVCNLVTWHQKAYGVDSCDRCSMVANPAFDAMGWELWPYLAAGAEVHLAPKDILRGSLEEITSWLCQQAITIAFLPTPLAVPILDAADWQRASNLRAVLIGGDTLNARPVDPLPFKLFNNYGPTESTVVATQIEIGEIGRSNSESRQPPSIGKPITNTQVYILDSRQQLVPIGVPGELCIAGDGLARGYLNDPELTSKQFIDVSGRQLGLDHEDPVRLYKTGDRARWRSDGNVEFLGRLDHQVKLRGFRIELGEIEATLQRHAQVRDAVVLAREIAADQDGASVDRRLVGYVVPESDALDDSSKADDAEYLVQWESLYEDLYQQPSPEDDPTFNTVGWRSSYTGEALSSEAMEEWLEATLTDINALEPACILEIGCGTGLLLNRLAPKAEIYWGTDFSRSALDYVAGLREDNPVLRRVELRQQRAEDFEELPQGFFDTVILNSVVQYFPNIEYLFEVIEGAVETLAPGGRVYIGDVRSLPLHAAFHATVQTHKALPGLPTSQWHQRVRHHQAMDKELVIDPAFFVALRQRLPRIVHVDVHPKEGRYVNELNQFRYQAVLYLDEAPEPLKPTDLLALDWATALGGLDGLRHRLEGEDGDGPEALRLQQVPNARLTEARQLARWLEAPPALPNVAALREQLQCEGQHGLAGVDPQELSELAQRLGYRASLSWARGDAEGAYDVLLQRQEQPPRVLPMPEAPLRPWRVYGNRPLWGQWAQRLMRQLRLVLGEQLPEYMVPSTLVPLESLPLSANGKIDRKALPAPDEEDWRGGAEYIAPRTPVEDELAKIWAEVLGLDQVGIHDNFFALGGHSLLATQLVARIDRTLGLCLSLASVFDASTLGEMAEHLENLQVINQGTLGSHYKEIQL